MLAVFRQSTRPWALIALLVVIDGGVQNVPCRADAADRFFSQKPEVAPSRVHEDAAAPLRTLQAPESLKEGPAPFWIWGPNPDHRYFLRKEFPGGSKGAWIKAAGDNEMTVYLNGHRVAASDNWSEPVEVEVQDWIQPGKNELIVEATNAGGPSGFALKLALGLRDNSTRYVVTDESWRVAETRDAKNWAPARKIAVMGQGSWGDVFSKTAAAARIPRDTFEVPAGFKVELLFTVPREKLGSWVAIGFDNKGRLIASDQQDKGLCRITLPPIGSDQPTKVEHLDAKITAAQGILYAFDSLYLSVNGGPGSGLYRARDTDGDDQFDKVERLADYRGGGEHGPHALRLAPDGKSIYGIAGNFTAIPERTDASRVPRNWGEDHLIPRQWDGNGFARGLLAPGGWVAKTDPEGKSWEIFSTGYRNPYDMDFNADGELFAYDADMEWDYGMPWYRPTRVSHTTSGSEFGWRSGTGKWPAYYIDSLPAIVDIGPGSPVGVCFGYGSKFPAKYQKALFVCDWTFGTMYAIHIEPSGASYKAVKTEFVSRTPLPLTDVAAGPDGALYFTIGGRGTQSELYRVTYVGKEPVDPVDTRDAEGAPLRAIRHQLEAYHHRVTDQAKAVTFSLPYLGHADRFIRYAARIALEHQDPLLWQDQALAAQAPDALINGAVAVAHQADKSLGPKVLAALERLDFSALPESQKLDLLRAWSLVFLRLGPPDSATTTRLIGKLDPLFPSKHEFLDRELANMLVYLKSPTIITKLIDLMKQERGSGTAEIPELLTRNPNYGGTIAKMLTHPPDAQKIHYAFALRTLRDGWTLDQRLFYFRWLHTIREIWNGGASYANFIKHIDEEAFENASETERLAIEASGARVPFRVKELPKPQGPGREWTLDGLLTLSKDKMTGRNFAHGQRVFSAARCVLCHRFNGDGGATGPDLSQVAGRFGAKDICEAIIDPSKVVSDQYRASVVATESGKIYTGKVLSETPKALTILVDPEDSTKVVEVPKVEIDEIQPSKTSLMPAKLLDTLNPNEVLDLLAYLLSRGDPKDPMFGKK